MSRPQCFWGLAALCCVLTSLLIGCGRKDVAVVNGTGVSEERFVKELESGPYAQRVLKGMLDRILIDDAFARSGLKLTPEKLATEIKQWRESQGFANDQAFQAFLVQQGISEADVRREFETGLKLQMLGEKGVKYTDQDLQGFYQKNRGRYDEQERVSFAEIIVGTQKEAEEVYNIAKKPDAKFPDLAKRYSVAPSRAEGGQRPLQSSAEILPLEARDRAFAMAVGDVSPSFEVAMRDGGKQWWVIKVTDHRPKKQLNFQEARDKVEKDYKMERMVQPADLIQRFSSQARVEIKDPRFAALQRLYMESSLLRNAPGGAGAGQPGAAPGGPAPAQPAPPAPQGAQPPAGPGK